MTEEKQKQIEYIVENYPLSRQLEQSIEEASEFILAAQKHKRFPYDSSRLADLIEEAGDVLICMEQLRLYLGAEAFDENVEYKLEREKNRINAIRRRNEKKNRTI